MTGQDVLQYADSFISSFERKYGSVGERDFARVFAGCYYSFVEYQERVRSGGVRDGSSVFDVSVFGFDGSQDSKDENIGECVDRSAERVDLVGAELRGRAGERVSSNVGVVRNEDGENFAGVDKEVEGIKGKNWKKNQRKAAARKIKHGNQLVLETGCERPVKDSLRLSLEKKWALENELKAAKAARELELLKAEDLVAVKKLRERKLQGATERTMVQIEKAHASLIKSGDVPGVQQGFCQTVVDGEIVESVPGLSGGESGGCSISPSSSISEREVRNMMKELEDLKKELEGYRRKDRLEADTLRMYNESVPVTLDENEQVPDEVIEMAGDKFEGPEYFIYGKMYEENGKKYRTMKFDRENYSRYGEEHW